MWVSGPQPLSGRRPTASAAVLERADAGVRAPVGDCPERGCSRRARRRARRPSRRAGCESGLPPSRRDGSPRRRRSGRRAGSPSPRSRSSTGCRGCRPAKAGAVGAFGLRAVGRIRPAIDHVDEGRDRQSGVGPAHVALLCRVAAGRAATAPEVDRHRPRPVLKEQRRHVRAEPARRLRSRTPRSTPVRRRSRRPETPRRGSARRRPAPAPSPAPAHRPRASPASSSETRQQHAHPLDSPLPPLALSACGPKAHRALSLPQGGAHGRDSAQLRHDEGSGWMSLLEELPRSRPEKGHPPEPLPVA